MQAEAMAVSKISCDPQARPRPMPQSYPEMPWVTVIQCTGEKMEPWRTLWQTLQFSAQDLTDKR